MNTVVELVFAVPIGRITYESHSDNGYTVLEYELTYSSRTYILPILELLLHEPLNENTPSYVIAILLTLEFLTE